MQKINGKLNYYFFAIYGTIKQEMNPSDFLES